MKIYFKISGMFISSNDWEFDFPDNTKLSNLLDYLTSNTDLIDETNTVWGITFNRRTQKKHRKLKKSVLFRSELNITDYSS